MLQNIIFNILRIFIRNKKEVKMIVILLVDYTLN